MIEDYGIEIVMAIALLVCGIFVGVLLGQPHKLENGCLSYNRNVYCKTTIVTE